MTTEPNKEKRASLIAPKEVIEMSRAVLGSIDLDPYSNPTGNRIISAARFFDRDALSLDDIIASDWNTSSSGRIFYGIPFGQGITASRRMLLKTLRDYRSGFIKTAIVWVGSNEVLSNCPWLWDFPICLSYRRLKPVYWDEEAEVYVKVTPSSWSFIVHMPPTESTVDFSRSLSQFHVCFTTMGRVVMNQYSGEDDWLHGYQAFTRKPYNFRG